jgi:hypothetical protein
MRVPRQGPVLPHGLRRPARGHGGVGDAARSAGPSHADEDAGFLGPVSGRGAKPDWGIGSVIDGKGTRRPRVAAAGRRGFAAIVLLSGLLAGGCVTSVAPYRPVTWPEVTGVLSPADAGSGRLQVIIAYGGLTSSHSALRLETAEGQVVFWDPAGDYGRPDLDLDPRWGPYATNVGRRSDLILGTPPDLGTYVRFRWGLEDQGVEVFEWDMSAANADTLRAILLGDGAHRGQFSTLAAPAFCSVAISDFLRRFGPSSIRVQGRHVFPHALARELYTTRPSRVLLFEPGHAPRAYQPPASASAPSPEGGRTPSR